MCTDEEYKKIVESGCNFSSDMKIEDSKTSKEVENIREESNRILRSILF